MRVLDCPPIRCDVATKTSEYDQKIPQSQTNKEETQNTNMMTDQRGRDTKHYQSQDSKNTIKVKKSAFFSSARWQHTYNVWY